MRILVVGAGQVGARVLRQLQKIHRSPLLQMILIRSHTLLKRGS